ncbi:hypothetical protein ACFW9I_36845 [[Kitasatospora] papulosa]|uniref:hypothetical protein n=1 Tax=[Kitasatospora] papulosa TaxID=1464011 RepID=UPI003682BF9B
MPEDPTSRKGSSADPAGDFASVRRPRRRRGSTDRGAAAAELLSNADDVAASSFLGTGTTATPPGLPSPAPAVDLAFASASTVASPSAAPVVASPGESAPSPADVSGTASELAPSSADHRAEPQLKAEPEPEPEPGPEPKAAPEAEGEHETKGEATGTGRTQAAKKKTDGAGTSRRRRSQYGPVQQEVWNSFIDSQVHSRNWDSQGVNLIPGLWTLLRTRMGRDRRSSGRPNLNLGHYLDAAMRTAPLDQGELVALADRIEEEQMGLPKGKKTTLSLSPAAIENVGAILEQLEEVGYARKGKAVVSALVQQMLRALEAEGPLPKPEMPPLV